MRARKTGTETRQEQIVKAALEIIGTEGVAALSISGIAARVGIVPSAIYRHFRGKDAVLDAILEYIRTRVMGNVELVREEAGEGPERLRLLLQRHVRMLHEIRIIPYILFSDGILAGQPEWREKVKAIMTAYIGEIRQLIREGIEEGSIRQDLDQLTAALMFLGMIIPAAVFSNIADKSFDLVAHAEKVWPAYHEHITAHKRESLS